MAAKTVTCSEKNSNCSESSTETLKNAGITMNAGITLLFM